jgi:hypothetical protein
VTIFATLSVTGCVRIVRVTKVSIAVYDGVKRTPVSYGLWVGRTADKQATKSIFEIQTYIVASIEATTVVYLTGCRVYVLK